MAILCAIQLTHKAMMIALIDNYDSFTYNLAHMFQALKKTVSVFRNDAMTLSEIEKLNPSHLVISPGPGRPEDAGITLDCIKMFCKKIPILGVCLGHQAIAHTFGATITNAKKICHGKTSPIFHNSAGVFKEINNPFSATRYHSLAIQQDTLSDDFAVTAWTTDSQNNREEIMGIKHKSLPLEGVQFHPESILTEAGYQLLENFLTTRGENR